MWYFFTTFSGRAVTDPVINSIVKWLSWLFLFLLDKKNQIKSYLPCSYVWGCCKREVSCNVATDVESCGRFVSEETPCLAASPISLMTIPFLCQTGLKINHGFYYQIQGQLAIFPTRTVHLCVYTHSDFKVFMNSCTVLVGKHAISVCILILTFKYLKSIRMRHLFLKW